MVDDQSLNQLERYIEFMYEAHSAGPGVLPTYLAVNKSDLAEDRTLTTQQVEEFVKKHQIRGYLETSAKTGENVELMFRTLIIDTFNRDYNLTDLWTRIANGESIAKSNGKNKCLVC
jgi:GTPase Era involved in 16S rRNA processing